MEKTVKQYLEEHNGEWAKRALKIMPRHYNTGTLNNPSLSDFSCFDFAFDGMDKKFEYWYFTYKYIKQ